MIAFIHNRRPGAAIVKHTHEYIANVTEPTCTEGGYTIYKCKCGETYESEYTEALGHDFGTEWHKDATGHWHGCSRCDEKKDFTEHLAGAEATTDTPQTCVVCGYEIAPALHTHAYGDWEITVKATCTTAGQKVRRCVCGVSEEEEIPALGHDITSTVTEPPTCTSVGWRWNWCTRECGYSHYSPVEKVAHTEVAINAVPATCTESGSSAGSKCSVCNSFLKEPETILPYGHAYRELGSLYKEATCTEDAVYYGKCVRCGIESHDENDTLTKAYTATGHKWVPVGTSTVCEYCGIVKT